MTPLTRIMGALANWAGWRKGWRVEVITDNGALLALESPKRRAANQACTILRAQMKAWMVYDPVRCWTRVKP